MLDVNQNFLYITKKLSKLYLDIDVLSGTEYFLQIYRDKWE